MGFIIALAVILMLLGTIGAACLQFGTKLSGRSLSWLLLPLGIYLCFYVYDHEQGYYLKRGAPQIAYAQVKGISDTRISIYKDDFRSESQAFTILSRNQMDEISESDIVKITYVHGIYRSYAIKIEELVVKE